jgi:nitrate reductase cytochrome c-type subunit
MGMWNGSAIVENSLAVPKTSNKELPHNSEIPLIIKIIKNRCLTKNCTGRLIHNSQKMGTTQVSTNTWMDKQNVVYSYKEIVFCHKKE